MSRRRTFSRRQPPNSDENLHGPGRALTEAPRWTQERLLRSVRRLVGEGLAEASLLAPVAPKAAPDRLLAVVAGIVLSEPQATLRAIGARLEALHERTPRGGGGWKPGSVAHVIARARKAGLLPTTA